MSKDFGFSANVTLPGHRGSSFPRLRVGRRCADLPDIHSHRDQRRAFAIFGKWTTATVDEATTTAYPTTSMAERQFASHAATPGAPRVPARRRAVLVSKGPSFGPNRDRHRQHRR